jgi:hypothetical protein
MIEIQYILGRKNLLKDKGLAFSHQEIFGTKLKNNEIFTTRQT